MLELYDLPDEHLLARYKEKYPELDVTALICFLKLLRVASDVESSLNTFLTQFDISQRRFFILILLTRRLEGWTPSELAKGTGVTNATMTGVLDTLVKDGLVERKTDPEDRRVKVVVITPKGEELMDKIFPQHYGRVARLMEDFDSRQRDELLETLDKIQNSMGKM
ncbi:MarR family winged helix-turn-helix transcriptional regulator [Salidesulfovibrio onnuriiensis]|uniref:MarR family winged helix-turn-helix transcriptional regulator n=1 Tax=Salidesulfovibrio onnuriiensis TaxID=2583823 RepID=UPI0011C74C01|nr:MarR family transcriptional regulator [Salidesulfovibrio onnuriiensis]